MPAVVGGLDVAGIAGLEAVVRSVARLAQPGGRLQRFGRAWMSDSEPEPPTIELDTSGTVDVGAEIARLGKDLALAQKEIADTTGKLGNAAFVGKAPAAVVDKIRARLARAAGRRRPDLRPTRSPGRHPISTSDWEPGDDERGARRRRDLG